jgi:iron(III) transport system substrate-binding protein
MRKLIPLLLAAFLASCGGGSGERLVIYSPHGKEMLSEYERRFEERHPEVDVQWLDMGGQDAYDRIRTEKANPQADVWWGGDSPTFARAADEGLLAPYRPTWADAVTAAGRDPLDRWYATYRTPEVILYNDATVKADERPTDWDDLLNERWRERIIIRYPLASSTMRTIWGALIMRQPTVEDGYAWLARLDMNTRTYAADPTQLYLKVARREGDVSLWNMPDTEIQTEINGYPFDFAVPASGTPLLYDGIAVVAGTDSPDAARRFYEFVTSDSALVDQARTYFRIPVRSDIDPELLPGWMRRPIPEMPIDWARLGEEGPTWMRYWDERIKGRGEAWLRDSGRLP